VTVESAKYLSRIKIKDIVGILATDVVLIRHADDTRYEDVSELFDELLNLVRVVRVVGQEAFPALRVGALADGKVCCQRQAALCASRQDNLPLLGEPTARVYSHGDAGLSLACAATT